MLGHEGSKARPSYTRAHCGRPPVSTPTRPPSHATRGEKTNLARGARTDLATTCAMITTCAIPSPITHPVYHILYIPSSISHPALILTHTMATTVPVL
jgi:hypothetical protein